MAPVLAYPRDGCMYILDTDASNIGVGAVLSQSQDGMEKVVTRGRFLKETSYLQGSVCIGLLK
jgi:hypothetical protein